MISRLITYRNSTLCAYLSNCCASSPSWATYHIRWRALANSFCLQLAMASSQSQKHSLEYYRQKKKVLLNAEPASARHAKSTVICINRCRQIWQRLELPLSFEGIQLIVTRSLDEDISRLDTDHKKSWAQIEAEHLKLFLKWYLDAHPSARKLSNLKTFFRQWRQLYTLETAKQFDLKMSRDVNNVCAANTLFKISY